MSIAGPFTHLDYAATPTDQSDGAGGTYPVYPPLAGVFCITDLATFAAYSDALTAFRVFPVPAQAVLAGDDPANPLATVTLHFADAAAAVAVVDPINALPPIPAPPPPPPVVPETDRAVQSFRFKAALRIFPSPTGVEGRTLRDDVDAAYASWPGADQDAWMAPEFFRADARLNGMATSFTGGDVEAAQQLLDAIFAAADAIP